MRCETCGQENVEGARFCASCGALLPIHSEQGQDPLVGQLIGARYRVTGVLGEGDMDVVYVGEQQMGSTVRKVAIKTLHPHLSKDPSVLARFHRECGTVAQLEHPNTIKFFDFGSTSDGRLYIAMEFVAGQPLNELIEKEGPIAPARVIKIMRQVCGALDEAHKQGIIHRDLKPENVVLTNRAGETDFVKVLDFGIAARTESADARKEQKLTQQGMVLGTPPYMSPEQFTGKALNAQSDIYSLGVMAYEMLTGRLPFDADTPWQWATQHMTAQPLPFEATAPSRDIPPGMRQAILKALHKDREQRQATAREFFSDLSEGGRLTVEHAAGRHESTGTAEMGAVPDFAGAPPPAPLAAPAAGYAAMHAPAAGPSAVAAPVPAPPMGSRGKRGGKGLIIGLGLTGAVLLVAIVVVAARSLKPDSGTDQPLANPFTSASAVATIAPQTEPEPTASVAPQPQTTAVSAERTAVTKPTGAAGSKKSKGTATEQKPPAGASATEQKPPAGASATGPKGPPNTAACDACISAAQAGNIQGAAANFNRCTDAAKKGSCKTEMMRSAPSSAQRAAFNGNCAQAKAIVAAAQAAGAGSGKLTQAVASCK